MRYFLFSITSEGENPFNKKPCFDNSLKNMVTGWHEFAGTADDGSTFSAWFYFNTDGSMYTGWIRSKGLWYYLEPQYGLMYSNGLYEIDNVIYKFTKTGAMLTGWNPVPIAYEDGTTVSEWIFSIIMVPWQPIGLHTVLKNIILILNPASCCKLAKMGAYH